MDSQLQQILTHLIRTQRIAALGTLHEGAPLVSMVLYAASPDFSAFYIHISRLAQHTRDILQDTRVSLMIAETDSGAQDPQTLARVSIRSEAAEVPPTADNYVEARSLYLQKFPQTAFNFELEDFALYRVQPHRARYVAGFGQIVNLTLEDFKWLASVSD